MKITATRSTASKISAEWNDNFLTAYESGDMPKDTVLICMHKDGNHPQHEGTTVAIDRFDLIRFLRAIEASTEITS